MIQMKAFALPTLAVALAATAVAFPVPAAKAQQGRGYEAPARFPGLRKAFRQIRGDIRYHASAIRSTASHIRHDVGSAIRGEVHRHAPGANQYGYRGEESYPQDEEEYYPPRDIYPPRDGSAPPFYDDREFGPKPRVRRQIERPEPPQVRSQPRRESPRESDREPEIVAPKEAREQSDEPSGDEPTRRDERRPQPDPRPDPEPEDSQPASDPGPPVDQSGKKPAVGKIVYPEAKHSDRPGFHFSPYEPYELLDTRGIDPGELAKDPGNGKIFRIPK